MPTKKQATAREREIANKKKNPISKINRPAVAQNGEAEPPRRSRRAE